MPTLHLQDVHLTRGITPVFAGLQLKLTEDRIGLIGNNGAGKTSLLRLLCGFGFYLASCCQVGRMLYQYRQTGYISPSRTQKFSLFCLPVIFAAMWLLWIRTVPYNQIAIYLVGGVLAVATYLQYFVRKSN